MDINIKRMLKINLQPTIYLVDFICSSNEPLISGMVACVINTYSGYLKHPWGKKKKVIIFPISLVPKVPVLHMCICVTALKKSLPRSEKNNPDKHSANFRIIFLMQPYPK